MWSFMTGPAAAAARRGRGWTFRVFGHAEVSLLDGGWGKWQKEGRPTETGAAAFSPGVFAAKADLRLVRTLSQMLANISEGADQVIDARSAARFAGEAPEPWPHKKVGHIPHSLNLPWNDLIDPTSGTVLPPDRLRALFTAAGLDFQRPVVTTCGSGVTACVLAFALFLLGKTDAAVYDGSWAEWGLDEAMPVQTGSGG